MSKVLRSSKKTLSFILALLMLFSMCPIVKLEVDAASISAERQSVINYMTDMATVKWTAGADFTTIKSWSSKSKLSFSKGKEYYGIPYSQNVNLGTVSLNGFETLLSKNNNKISSDVGRNDCSYTVYKSWSTVDSGVKTFTTATVKPGSNNVIAVGTYTYKSNKATTCTYNGKTKMYAAYSCLQPGDAVVRDGHIMLVVGVDSTNQKITVTHQSSGNKYFNGKSTSGSTASKRNTTWGINEVRTYSALYSDGYIPITCKALANSSSVNYTITLSGTSNVTNTSAAINVKLNEKATVKKWTYFLSTNKSEVSNVKGAVGSTHKTTSTMDCVRILDYTSNPQSQSAATFTISKYQGNALKANTTYYYKATVYIGNKWYESSAGSFTTAKNKPGTPTVRVSSSSQTIGIGDQATVLWEQASGAEKYTITVKNSSGTVVQTKSNVTGTTCVLDGIKSAGTYTVGITAINSAGSTVGNSATITVKPNVTVTFYDTISKKVIATKSVAYGHSATAPKNPQQVGHTFSKWDKSYNNVTSNITVNTVYDKNSYTVKFVDSFTNQVLKQQTLKYGESATAPTSVSAPTGYSLTAWDKSYSNVTSDLTVYTVYKWTDTDNTATATINSVKRNTTKQGYDVSVSVKNQISEISSGRVVVVLKSSAGVVLTSTESAAFAIDSLGSKTLSITVLYPELAPKVEVYVVNGYENLGQISKVATANIDNSSSSAWSSWITYTGTCPMSTGNGVTVEKRTLTSTTPEKKYYRYQTKETTTSYSTSLSGYTQNGYSLVKSSSGSISYVSSWPSGFSTSNSLYKQYNVTPKSASETATQKVVIDSTSTQGYIYWHWCRGDSVGAINRATNWSKTSTFDTFHAFYSTTKKSYSSSANAFKWQNTSACKDTYWWNGLKSGSDGLVTVKKQNYTIYNKLYNYYKYSAYTGWIEYSGSVPVSNGASAGTNKTYQNVETKTVAGTTTYTYQYRYMTTTNPTISEPTVASNRIYTLSGNVGSKFAGKTATVWVYKYAQASDYTTEYVGTTTVGSDGSVTISNAKLRETPTIESGDFTIVVSVAGQAKSIEIGKIEAPKPTYTVTFYDFDRTTVLSTQTITEGENATLPSEDSLTVPDGSRFTNWSESVVNVRSNMNVYPESETEVYVVAFVNWETQTVALKEFNYGAELVADGAPEGKEGYVTEWVVQDGDSYLTIDEFTVAGKTVTGHMVVETRSTPEQYKVTIIDADASSILNSDVLATEGVDSFEVADEYTVENGNYIDFSEVQTSIEENEEYVFTGWINAYTGEAIETTEVKEEVLIYPSYTFAETTAVPEADVETGEYTSEQTVTLTCETEGASIWYTTDSTDPMTSSTAKEYTAPLTISSSCILRYYAGSLGRNDSVVDYRIYAINSECNDKYHIVVIWSELIEESGADHLTGLVKDGDLIPEELLENVYGYNFEGLYWDAQYNEIFNYETEGVTQSAVFCAKYTAKEYVVAFVDYDGTEIDKQSVAYSKEAIAPTTPEREGYVFIGWDKDFDCITEDTVIVAQYISTDDYASVSLNRTRPLNLSKGTTFKFLKATITPAIHSDYELEWTSSEPLVATVDENGFITAVSEGTTIITVKVVKTNATATLTVNITTEVDGTIILKTTSTMGFDDAHNLRAVPIGSNSVEELREHFENDDLVFCDADGNELAETAMVGTGAVIKLYDGDTVIDSTTVVLTGDFNRDGYVNNKDVVMMNQYVLEKRVADEIQMIAIDVNGDGYVNNRDCAMLARYLVDKETL